MLYTVQIGNKFNVNACHTHEYVCIRMYVAIHVNRTVLIHMHAL